MFDWFKKKRPTVSRQDLLDLIAATPNASPRTHLFLVPDRLQGQMKRAIRKNFWHVIVCLWWEQFEGYSMQPTFPEFGEPDELTLFARKDRKHYIGTTCR